MPTTAPPLVMIFAASDPTGGAGLQADLMTVSSMGCYGVTVVTGITVQDTAGVEEFMPLDSDLVDDQARVVLEDMPVAAFKIGVLGSVETVAVVAEIVSDYPDVPLVLDPVLTSGRGDPFADDEIVGAIRELLIPQTTIITPNSIEARKLAAAADHGEAGEDGDEDDAGGLALATCAARLIEWGSEFVLITGTHENTAEVINVLYSEAGPMRSDSWERLAGSYHGSGCTLASAIAALLATGLDVPEAIREAQEYTWQTLAAGFRPGMGQHLPDRFFWARDLEGNGQGDASRKAER